MIIFFIKIEILKKSKWLNLNKIIIAKITLYFIIIFSYQSLIDCKLLSKVEVKKTDFRFIISLKFNGEDFRYNKQYLLKKNLDSISITKIRFYLTNIEILFSDNSKYMEKFSYHLIDLDDNKSLEFVLKNIPKKEISNIKFCLGVDSITNVSGALNGDLDPRKGMYWSWNSGYINLKMEGNYYNILGNKNSFEYHIGGYISPNNSLRNLSFNIVKNFKTNYKINLVLDLGNFFDSFDYKNNRSVLIPGAESNKVMDGFKNIFKVSNNEN